MEISQPGTALRLVVDPWSWSPDGRLVVVKGQDGTKLVEVATGRIIRAFPADDAVWVDNERLLHRSQEGPAAVILTDAKGQELERQPLPAELHWFSLTVAPR